MDKFKIPEGGPSPDNAGLGAQHEAFFSRMRVVMPSSGGTVDSLRCLSTCRERATEDRKNCFFVVPYTFCVHICRWPPAARLFGRVST